MTALDRLLVTGRHLDISIPKHQHWGVYDTRVIVEFVDCLIKDKDGVLRSWSGCGRTLEEACEDYIKGISCKTLVFGSKTKHKTEVYFI